MSSPNKFVERVNKIFETEEKIGVTYQNDEGVLESDFVGDKSQEEFSATLPTGLNMSRCTNCAHFVVSTLGEGNVYGFTTKRNPVASKAITWCFGHDFAVIRKRYIVDIWISLYGGHEKQTVYDLLNPKDHAKIAHHYGDPQNWGMADPQTEEFIWPEDLPEEFKITNRSQEKANEFNPSIP